ncbi:uncharacterized protein BDR25DRAFT_355684 [Lindgomyces ingoldianus]|uniref:Uncharacterized protein n=1 Tax=Lindgomyces ingoldianus TaxID=673940 RepID=A0ACB6QV53_9PLEO|nr:uncharacterized protein BDR25DRAFT_355684 [Lindgomyces ingoldianus]KAF2469957.1 hypothetical protein BDR25DRAFT_355684 [Lindgomyces ingoldianus]
MGLAPLKLLAGACPYKYTQPRALSRSLDLTIHWFNSPCLDLNTLSTRLPYDPFSAHARKTPVWCPPPSKSSALAELKVIPLPWISHKNLEGLLNYELRCGIPQLLFLYIICIARTEARYLIPSQTYLAGGIGNMQLLYISIRPNHLPFLLDARCY